MAKNMGSGGAGELVIGRKASKRISRAAGRANVEAMESRALLASISFAPSQSFAATSCPSVVRVGDYNGDGKVDLAVLDFAAGSVGTMAGNGDGTFGRLKTRATGSFDDFVFADFNGDGKDDLATISSTVASVQVLLSNGDGTFRSAIDTLASAWFHAAAAADLNEDGILDLVAVGRSNPGGVVQVLLSKGDGTFQPGAFYDSYDLGSPGQYVAISDLNGDGHLDLIVSDGLNLSVLLGKGDGTFGNRIDHALTAAPSVVVAADFDRDKRVDLAVIAGGKQVDILLGNGDGTLTEAGVKFGYGYNYDAMVGADFDSDGNLDLALCDYDSRLLTMMTGADGGFSTAWSAYPELSTDMPKGIAAGDFNGDGKTDLAYANAGWYAGKVSVLLNTTVCVPVAAVTTPVFGLAGNIPISYSLMDGESDDCSITVEFSSDEGATWVTATSAGGDGMSNLASSRQGTAHTFIWDSATDLGAGTTPSVQLRITPSDSDPGIWGITPDFRVKNGPNVMPSATVSLDAHVPLTTDVLTATATKTDPDGDPVNLTFVWKVNGEVKRTFWSATALTDTLALADSASGLGDDTVTVEVTPDDGVVAGTMATDSATVANVAPWASFASGGNVTLGSGSVVGFSGVRDAAADLAAGFLYSYDLNNDGTYEVVNSGSATCVVPPTYLATVGKHTVRGMIQDQHGASRTYSASVLVNAPSDYFPMTPGLTWTYSGRDGADSETWTYTSSADVVDGRSALRMHAVERGFPNDNDRDSDQWFVGNGSVVSLVREYDSDSTSTGTSAFSSPIPWYPVRLGATVNAIGSPFSVTMTFLQDGVQANGSGTDTRAGTTAAIEPLTLSNGIYFSQALRISTTDILTMHLITSDGHVHDITQQASVTTDFVRGIGLVYESMNVRSQYVNDGQASSDNTGSTQELSSIPVWARFITQSNGVVYVNGSDADDTITLAVDETYLMCYRNGVPQSVPLAGIQGVVINGLGGDDLLDASALTVPVTIDGGSGNDTITGGSGADSLMGGPGNDVIYGDGGVDTILGGAGSDSISGGAGADSILGGGGADTIFGGSGADTVLGGGGADLIYGQRGTDSLDGGAGDDVIFGGGGADTLVGGRGNELIYAGGGEDWVYVNDGSVVSFHDTVYTGAGTDHVDHDTADTIIGDYVDILA